MNRCIWFEINRFIRQIHHLFPNSSITSGSLADIIDESYKKGQETGFDAAVNAIQQIPRNG